MAGNARPENVSSGLRISGVCGATPEEWDRIWNACGYATYFHSREWSEIWCAYSKSSTPSPLCMTFSDGRRMLFVLVRDTLARGALRRFASAPAGTFGGWISDQDLTPAHTTLAAGYAKRKFSSLTWRFNPYDPLLESFASAGNAYDETQAVDLSPGIKEALHGWSKGAAAAVAQAGRMGVQVRLAATENDWRQYFGVYRMSVDRWAERATSTYDWDLFRIIHGRNSPRTKLWLATHDEEVIAGALCLYGVRHVAYWHGAALEQHFNRRPVNLLMHHAIKDACEHGYRWFDFNPSGGHEGVRKFKKGFGTLTLPAPMWIHASRTLRGYLAVRKALASSRG